MTRVRHEQALVHSLEYSTFMNRLTSHIQDFASAKAQSALLTVLASGPIPQHVAFIMDGNRRYARSHHKQVAQGHGDGYEALKRVRSRSFSIQSDSEL